MTKQELENELFQSKRRRIELETLLKSIKLLDTSEKEPWNKSDPGVTAEFHKLSEEKRGLEQREKEILEALWKLNKKTEQ
jgi:hypothetical protein